MQLETLMTVDLSTWKPGDWLRTKDNALFRFSDLHRWNSSFYLTGGNIQYSSDGIYMGISSNHGSTIVEIIPAERMTLLEWITDREPTKEDAVDGEVVWFDNGKPISLRITPASKLLSPWAHCPGWQPPAPEHLTPEVEIAALKARVAELEARIND